MPTPPVWDMTTVEHPHLLPVIQFLSALSKESPRGKVLIASGFIEQQLRDVLAAFMTESADVESLLDGANAPLGTFSARVAACYALALITDDERHDLNLIRRIRNEFAHQTEISFESPAVRDRCKSLRMKAPDYIQPDGREVKMDTKGEFETSAVAIIMNLINRPHYVGLQRRTTQAWPY